jgi:hypothetical protein
MINTSTRARLHLTLRTPSITTRSRVHKYTRSINVCGWGHSTTKKTSFVTYPDIVWSTMPEPRKHPFEKVVMLIDVRKLNRLVIAKQYIEKYFPLDEASIEDKEKGVLLNFKDINTRMHVRRRGEGLCRNKYSKRMLRGRPHIGGG